MKPSEEQPQVKVDQIESGRFAEIVDLYRRPATIAGVCIGGAILTWGVIQNSEELPRFEQPLWAAAALATIAGGAMVAREQRNTFNELSDGTVFADPDQTSHAENAVKMQKRTWLAGSILVTAAFAGYAFDEAQPYTEKTRSTVNNVAVIVDASTAAYAKDVLIESDSSTKDARINVAVNSFNTAKLGDDTTVTFIAAGLEPKSMGEVSSHGEGRSEMQKNFESYNQDPRLALTADIKGALGDSSVEKADKVIIITGSLEDVPVSALKGEATPGNRRTSVVALGVSGSEDGQISEASNAGRVVKAPLNQAANTKRVGDEDSYTAASREEMESVINEIVRTQYTVTERNPFNGFETLRNDAAKLLTFGLGLGFVIGSTRRSINRRKA